MPRACAKMIASALRDLGHEVPSDEEIDKLLSKAMSEVKRSMSLDEKKYDLRVVAIPKDLKIDG